MAGGNSLADKSFTFKVFYYSLVTDVTYNSAHLESVTRAALVRVYWRQAIAL